MTRNDREARDAAGVGPYAKERERLVALSSLDSWTVSDGEPDIRGWEVRTVNNRQLGTVKDLLVDPDAGEAVLLDVDLPGSDRHTFVPIRVVQIERSRRVVLMDSADLPVDDIARSGDATPVGRRASDVSSNRTVRYPRGDREVVIDRPPIADAAAPRDVIMTDPRTDAVIEERRRAERRRIERLSTDL
jgi:hypothetical protein